MKGLLWLGLALLGILVLLYFVLGDVWLNRWFPRE
jgi:hypothetical protein